MEPRFVIVETACPVAQVGLGLGEQVVALRRLDQARRHARDLVPALSDLLRAQGWKMRNVTAVVVSRGPGSYTGLRVGLMTAKALVYATRCTLLALDTFPVIARQAPAGARRVDVLADAQQDKVYVQAFERSTPGGAYQARTALTVQRFNDWLAALAEDVWLSGPGLHKYAERLRDRHIVDVSAREPRADSLLHVGLDRLKRGECDDFWALEPLYLRPSAAEEKWLERR